MSNDGKQQHNDAKSKEMQNDEQQQQLSEILVERISTLFPRATVTWEVALQLLEASNDNVDVAVSLFCDTNLTTSMSASGYKSQQQQYSASTLGQKGNENEESESDSKSNKPPSAARRRSSSCSSNSSNGSGNRRSAKNPGIRRRRHYHHHEEKEVKERHIRRRLESRSKQDDGRKKHHHDERNRDQEQNDNGDVAMEEHPQEEPLPANENANQRNDEQPQVDNNADNNNQDNNINIDQDNNMENPNPVEADNNNRNAIAGSVSVSEDEGIWRVEGDGPPPPLAVRIRRNSSDHHDDDINHDAALHNQDDDHEDGGPMRDYQDSLNNNRDDETYLSEDDWITGTERSYSAPKEPLEILWGKQPKVNSTIQDSNHDNDQNFEHDPPPLIPLTWLHAGFTMDPTVGAGLILKAPNDEDAAFYRMKQQQQDANSNASDTRAMVLPPHHCKAVTAILAIVNATMLSGASVQGTRVDCSSAQTPFCELTESQRVKEFDKRLAEAIAALMFVARKASIARKQAAIDAIAVTTRTRDRQQTDYNRMQQQHLQRRLRLCPNCRWQEDATTGETLVPQAREAHRIKLVHSFTNVDDLQSHVQSNMRLFTGRGGVALFLETIIRIHGRGTVEHLLMTRCRGKKSLIHCTCSERQDKKIKTTTNTIPILDTTPPGHECASIELLSLLICGDVHSTLNKEWLDKNNSLGFGFISNVPGELVATKPNKKVWILRGDTCHTVAWMDTAKLKTSIHEDHPTTLHLCHWNFWYEQRHFSTLRIVTARKPYKGASNETIAMQKGAPRCSGAGLTVMDRIKMEQQQHRKNIVSCDEDETFDVIMKKDYDDGITDVIPHSQDEQYYPTEYRRWRYQFESSSSTSVKSASWIPYYALTIHQQEMVEQKFAPRISTLLRLQWPHANVILLDKDGAPPPSPPIV